MSYLLATRKYLHLSFLSWYSLTLLFNTDTLLTDISTVYYRKNISFCSKNQQTILLFHCFFLTIFQGNFLHCFTSHFYIKSVNVCHCSSLGILTFFSFLKFSSASVYLEKVGLNTKRCLISCCKRTNLQNAEGGLFLWECLVVMVFDLLLGKFPNLFIIILLGQQFFIKNMDV